MQCSLDRRVSWDSFVNKKALKMLIVFIDTPQVLYGHYKSMSFVFCMRMD